jgi:hypothetical protein
MQKQQKRWLKFRLNFYAVLLQLKFFSYLTFHNKKKDKLGMWKSTNSVFNSNLSFLFLITVSTTPDPFDRDVIYGHVLNTITMFISEISIFILSRANITFQYGCYSIVNRDAYLLKN